MIKFNQEDINKFENINFKEIDINVFTLKINSKNRNLSKEQNPFNFEITFNNEPNNSKAVIQNKFENIKKIQLTQLVIPRYIPRNYMGEPFNGITPLYNTENSITLSYYPGININNSIISIYDASGNETIIEVLELVDLSCKKMYLIADQYNNPYKISKLMLLKSDLFSHLNINNNIYPITNITGNIIYLDNTTNYPLPIYTNERLIIGDFYKNTTIIDVSGNQIGITKNTIQINQANILNYQYIFSGQYIEYQVNSSVSTVFEKKLFLVSNITSQLININDSPSISNTSIIITGVWANGLPSNYSPTALVSYNSGYIIKINQFSNGIRDLLDEKIFYLNLYPFSPSKNVSTDDIINKSFGVLFPSTQSKDYLILRGESSESYTNINLQTTNNKIKFALLDSNNDIVGTIYDKYFNLYKPNNNISIRAYLPYYPDICMILKIDEIDRKLNLS